MSLLVLPAAPERSPASACRTRRSHPRVPQTPHPTARDTRLLHPAPPRRTACSSRSGSTSPPVAPRRCTPQTWGAARPTTLFPVQPALHYRPDPTHGPVPRTTAADPVQAMRSLSLSVTTPPMAADKPIPTPASRSDVPAPLAPRCALLPPPNSAAATSTLRARQTHTDSSPACAPVLPFPTRSLAVGRQTTPLCPPGWYLSPPSAPPAPTPLSCEQQPPTAVGDSSILWYTASASLLYVFLAGYSVPHFHEAGTFDCNPVPAPFWLILRTL